MRCFKTIVASIFMMMILLSSCQMNSNNKTITVHILDAFPYESEAYRPLWYKMSYSDSAGNTLTKRIPAGVHEVSLNVPKNSNTYVIVQALGDFYPQGGVIEPTSFNDVDVSFEQGYLVNTLLSITKQNPEALNCLNYSKLFQTLKDRKFLYSFDPFTLSRSILDGSLNAKNIYHLDNVRVDVTQLPAGFWVSDDPMQGSFWIHNFSDDNVILSLNAGIHSYLNYYEGYLCRIAVDSSNSEYFISLKGIPEDLK